MREIIKNREIVQDGWTHLADEDPIPAGADIVVSLERFLEDPETLLVGEGRLGVRLGPVDEPEALAPYFDRITLIAVDFPKFTDGRGYSTARLLRMRYGWSGELRAIGDVLPDQVFYMQRCGFDSFEVRADKKLDTALAALDTFSVRYQGAEDELPLYRRRHLARPRVAASDR